MGNFSADDILLNGGTVAEIIPVPDTYEYFVWVQVTSGTASLHIAINPGAPLLGLLKNPAHGVAQSQAKLSSVMTTQLADMSLHSDHTEDTLDTTMRC